MARPLSNDIPERVVAAVRPRSSTEPDQWRRDRGKLLSWYVFFAIGISYFYTFVAHLFFSKEAAAFIGRADSLFQIEVGTASLGFSVAGFLAAWEASTTSTRAERR